MTAQAERNKMLVMSIDPGETIGWSMGIGEELWAYGENDMINFMTRLSVAISSAKKTRVRRIVIERFDVRSFTDEAYNTVKVIGAIEWAVGNCMIPMAEVNAADKKRYHLHDNVVMLKRRSMGHASDAEALRLWDLKYGRW